MNQAIQLSSEAWLLRGISSIPGELKLADGRLSFTARGTGTAWKWQLQKLEREARQPGLANRIDTGKSALVFDVHLDQVEIDFPWYYFSGGLKVTAQHGKYRISLGRPPNTRLPVDRSAVQESGTRALEEWHEIRAMRGSGKAWKDVLRRAGRT